MRNISLKTNSPLLINIYNFVLNEKLYMQSDLLKIETKVASFYSSEYDSYDKDEIEQALNSIESFSFYDIDNYIVENNDNDSLLTLISILSKFKSELISKLTSNSEDRMYMDFGGLERKASPNMETYEYVGNNKLDITPTHRSYGLLFE